MAQALLIVHFLALAAGFGASVGGVVIMAMAGSRPPAEAAVLRQAAPRFGLIGRSAVTLLWLSGLGLLAVEYGFALADMSGWFWAKMIAVVVLTGAVAGIYMAELRVRGGDGGAAATIARLARLPLPAATLAAIFAVLAFSGG